MKIHALIVSIIITTIAATASAQTTTIPTNATRAQLRAIIARLNTQIAYLNAQVKALTPLPPSPVIVNGGVPLVLTDPVLSPGANPAAEWITQEQWMNAEHNADWAKMLARLLAMKPSTKWCVIDAETTWLDSPDVMLARDIDAGHVMAFCEAVRPDIRFGFYGWPVTTCDGDQAGSNDAKWHKATATCVGWRSGGMLAPSLYQGGALANPACVATSVRFALQTAAGLPVIGVVSNRVYDSPTKALADPVEITKHCAGAFSVDAVYVGPPADICDGLVFWRSDEDFKAAIVGAAEVPAGVTFAEWVANCDARAIAAIRNGALSETNPIPPALAPVVVPPSSGGGLLPWTPVAPINPTSMGVTGGRLALDGTKDRVSNNAQLTMTMAPFPGMAGLFPTPYHAILVNDNASAQRIEINNPVGTALLSYAAYIGGGSDIRINNPQMTCGPNTWENAWRIHTAQHVLIDGGWTDYRKGSKDSLRVYKGATVCVRNHTFMGGSIHIGWPTEGSAAAFGSSSNCEAWLVNVVLDNPNDTTGSKYPKPIIVYPGCKMVHLQGVSIREGTALRAVTIADVDAKSPIEIVN